MELMKALEFESNITGWIDSDLKSVVKAGLSDGMIEKYCAFCCVSWLYDPLYESNEPYIENNCTK